jgi:hypothetical protein
MKLTVGRMAHVKLEKGCAEALLTFRAPGAWGLVALRPFNGTDGAPTDLQVPEDVIHEPYGCMRAIVMLPEPEYSFFGPLPGSPIDQVATPGAQIDPGAPRLMQDLGFDPGREIVAGHLTKERYGWRCACGAMEQALYSSLNAAMQAGGAHRCQDDVRRTWSATWNAVT